MSRQLSNLRESKVNHLDVKDFTNAVDVKRFSKDRGNMTPINRNSYQFFQKIKNKSNEKIRNTQPTSLGISFTKNISQKNMQAKRKLSTGFPYPKTNNNSVSLDAHLLKEKYNQIKQLFENQKYQKIVPLVKNSLFNFQPSNAQKNMYYWLTYSLVHLKKFEEAIEQITECLIHYPNFFDGYLSLANIYFKTHHYRLAIDNFQICMQLNPKNHQPLLQLAYSYQKLRQHKNGIETCQSGLLKYPKEGQFLMILVQIYIEMKKVNDLDKVVKEYEQNFNRKDSLYLYIKGSIQNVKNNDNEAYILFEESLKYNNNRIGVSKSLMETIKIQIAKRDFYKAHHSVCRIKFLQIEETEQMRLYSIFIEGAMTMMKKKSIESIEILNKLINNKKCEEIKLLPLVCKYLGYGYFKISEYSKSIKYYNKLSKQQLDESSQYNKLLVEGIELAEKMNNYHESIGKFNSAKNVYPQKVQPYIYIAMSLIMQFNLRKDKDEVKKAQVLIQALKQLELGNRLNPNSSNLLYHRAIIHLFFQDWEEAHNDINRCIEKAQENLPKYFFLRGVCYTCVKEFKKAVNEHSICLSLDSNYSEAYLQKAKCYFLIGNTQKGFSSLKTFMELNPNDVSIYKWIGDLLYEGMSYQDSLKAYAELGEVYQLDVYVMKLKCLIRVGPFSEVSSHFKAFQKYEQTDKQKVSLDINAFNLLNAVLKNQNHKVIYNLLKKLNKLLEQNIVGYVFQLIDCMNLIGIASFYLQKYVDAYESFLLVLELYQSLCDKESMSLKSQSCDEELDLKTEDIYFNIILSEYAQGNVKESVRMMSEEYLNIINNAKKKKLVEKVIKVIKNGQNDTVQWDFKNDKPINSRLKMVGLVQPQAKIRSKPCFNLYHESASHLYTSSVAEQMVNELHPGYIDNMPEGPWIKRNPYGVVFTQYVIQADNSISFEDTQRVSQNNVDFSIESEQIYSQKKPASKRQQFLHKLKLDEGVEAKLNKMMLKKIQSSIINQN